MSQLVSDNLDPFSLGLLDLFVERGSLSLVELAAILDEDIDYVRPPIDYLIERRYLELVNALRDFDDYSINDKLRPTYAGIISCNSTRKSALKNRFNEIRAWITLSIAIIALILSFINYFTK